MVRIASYGQVCIYNQKEIATLTKHFTTIQDLRVYHTDVSHLKNKINRLVSIQWEDSS